MSSKIKSAIIISILVFTISSIALAATEGYNFNIPYVSYTFDFWDQPMAAPMPYVTDTIMDFTDSEIGSLRNPRD